MFNSVTKQAFAAEDDMAMMVHERMRANRAVKALAELVDRNATVSGETLMLTFGSHGEALTALRKARDCLARLALSTEKDK